MYSASVSERLSNDLLVSEYSKLTLSQPPEQSSLASLCKFPDILTYQHFFPYIGCRTIFRLMSSPGTTLPWLRRL